jgi:hypothetical protein
MDTLKDTLIKPTVSKPAFKRTIITSELKTEVRALREAGRTYRDIVSLTGVSRGSITNIMREGKIAPPALVASFKRDMVEALEGKIKLSLDGITPEKAKKASNQANATTAAILMDKRRMLLEGDTGNKGIDGMGIGDIVALAHKTGSTVRVAVEVAPNNEGVGGG